MPQNLAMQYFKYLRLSISIGLATVTHPLTANPCVAGVIPPIIQISQTIPFPTGGSSSPLPLPPGIKFPEVRLPSVVELEREYEFYPEPDRDLGAYLGPKREPIPLPPPSLKSVRQSVNIPFPSEPEISSLTKLPFDKMHPGVAGQADAVIDGRRVDFYQFEGNQDQQIMVVLRNSEDARPDGLRLMPYVTVFDPNRKVIAATVVPGSYRIRTTDPLLPLDNQLALRLPQSGRYVVAVFADPGEVGRYGIGWKQDKIRFRYDEIRELTGAESTEPAEIIGKAGQIVRVEALSYEFDPVVTLVDANGKVIAEDDDDGGNYNARIDKTLPADGTYRAIVSSADGRGQGQYRLRMR